MALSLSQKKRNLWIEIGALVGAGLIFKLLGFDMLAGLAILIVAFAIPFQLIPLFTRTESAEEAEARVAAGGQPGGKTKKLEEELSVAENDAQRRRLEADLLWKYLRAWQKSSVLVPNSLAGREIFLSPSDLEDGDLEALAKLRNLQASMAEKDPKRHKGLAKEVRKTDESVAKWRKTAEEIRDGTREAPDHFDANDYLVRLNAAFSPAG